MILPVFFALIVLLQFADAGKSNYDMLIGRVFPIYIDLYIDW